MADDVSVRALAELMDRLEKAIDDLLGKGLDAQPRPARQWISPYFEMLRRGPSTTGNTETHIQIVNPNPVPADVEVTFLDAEGGPIAELGKKVSAVGPLAQVLFMVGEESSLTLALGSLRVVASQPVFPAGNISTDRTQFTNVPGLVAPLQTVAFAMHFYPIAEPS